MPWTIPNLILHDKPARLGNMRSHGRNCVFVVCGNPDCHHNAEIDASGFPDEICNTGCSAQCAIIAAPTLARHGCIMADWAREFDEPIPASKGRQLVTLRDAAEYIQKLPEAEQLFEE